MSERERGWLATLDETGVAVEFSKGQIHNPAGSGVIVFVRKFWVEAEVLGTFSVARLNTPIVTEVATKLGVDGEAIIADVYKDTAAALTGSTFFGAPAPVAMDPHPYVFDPPIRLAPGQGVVFQIVTADQDCVMSFEGSETF